MTETDTFIGNYHSFRHELHKAAERTFGGREEIDIEISRPHHHHHERQSSVSVSSAPSSGYPNSVSIPCHHIHKGDILILQGRPCQVIRISTSAATGQYRYLGVDLFSKQLHEDSSFVSKPSPNVVIQTMLGPVLKQYRVLDMHDGTLTAMTETVSFLDTKHLVVSKNILLTYLFRATSSLASPSSISRISGPAFAKPLTRAVALSASWSSAIMATSWSST